MIAGACALNHKVYAGRGGRCRGRPLLARQRLLALRPGGPRGDPGADECGRYGRGIKWKRHLRMSRFKNWLDTVATISLLELCRYTDMSFVNSIPACMLVQRVLSLKYSLDDFLYRDTSNPTTGGRGGRRRVRRHERHSHPLRARACRRGRPD